MQPTRPSIVFFAICVLFSVGVSFLVVVGRSVLLPGATARNTFVFWTALFFFFFFFFFLGCFAFAGAATCVRYAPSFTSNEAQGPRLAPFHASTLTAG